MSAIPEGFAPLLRTSPYTELLGPIYQNTESTGLIIGLRIENKHCNARGLAHGGVLGTLADIAMGYAAAFSTEPPTMMVTASQTMDYVGKAELGDWVEVHTDVHKVGRSMAFTGCRFYVGARCIATASGVFSVVSA